MPSAFMQQLLEPGTITEAERRAASAMLQVVVRARADDDALLQWQPHAKQQAFIDSVLQAQYFENWLIASNRFGKCITPWTHVEMGSATRQIVEVLGETAYDVQSWDGGSQCTTAASAVFLKGILPALRLYLDNGEVFEATSRHRVLTPWGWASLGSLLSSQDGLHWSETDGYCQASYDTDNRLYGLQPQRASDTDRAKFLQGGDVPRLVHLFSRRDGAAPTPSRIHAYLASARLSRLDDHHLIAGLCELWNTGVCGTSGQSLLHAHQACLRSAGVLNQHPKAQQALSILDRADILYAYYALPSPVLLCGGLHLIGYQKIGLQPIVDFAVPRTHNYLAAGVFHHNSDVGAYCGASLARNGIDARPAVGSRSVVWDRATTGWIVGPDYQTLTQVLLPKYVDWPTIDCPPGSPHRPFIPEREIESWDQGKQEGKLKNGSLIRCKSNEQAQVRFAAAGVDWIHFDEEPTYRNYEEATLRVEGGRRLRIFGTCTLLPPEGQVGGVSWLYDKIIRPYLTGDRSIGLFSGSIYDNPYILPEEIVRLESKYPEGSAQRRIRLGGEWLPGIGGNRAYLNFDHAVHVRPQQPASPYLPLCWAIDFNVVPFCSLIGQYDGRRFRVLNEIVLEEGNIQEMVAAFRDLYPSHQQGIWLYGDASGGSRSVKEYTTDSHYVLIQRAMRDYPTPLKLEIPKANPLVTDRVSSVNYLLRNEVGESRVEVDPSCTFVILDMEQVLTDSRGGVKKTNNPRDPYYYRTHMSDALGYWLHRVAPVKLHTAETQHNQQTVYAVRPASPASRVVPGQQTKAASGMRWGRR